MDSQAMNESCTWPMCQSADYRITLAEETAKRIKGEEFVSHLPETECECEDEEFTAAEGLALQERRARALAAVEDAPAEKPRTYRIKVWQEPKTADDVWLWEVCDAPRGIVRAWGQGTTSRGDTMAKAERAARRLAEAVDYIYTVPVEEVESGE